MTEISFTTEKRAIRDECIRVCKTGLSQTLEFISAFKQLHDDRLYLETHSNWSKFCEEILGISKGYTHRLMIAAEVKESLPTKLAEKLTNPAQAIALASVPKQHRAEVLESAAKVGLTAASIKEQMVPIGTTNHPIESGKVAKSINAKAPSEHDQKGYEIPAEIVPLWQRRQELEHLMSQVSSVKCAIETALAAEDPLYRMIRNPILIELSGIHYQISRAKPYAVCTECQGFPKVNNCQLCRGTGLIGKETYESVTAKETREIRERKVSMERARR